MWATDFLKYLFEQFQHYILPFIVIPVYMRGVRLRWGRNPKMMNPGFHWKIPFADDVHTCIVTIDTMSTHSVHVTTLDQKTITVTPVIEFEVEDAIKFLIDVNDATTNLHDIVKGEVADYLTDINWDKCKEKQTITDIKSKINRKVKDMGVKIHRLFFSDICMARIYITQI